MEGSISLEVCDIELSTSGMNDEEGCEVVKGSEGEVIMIEVVLMEELSEV